MDTPGVRKSVTNDASLTLPDGWSDVRFERGTFGPDDREGFRATVEGDGATLEVLPVRYRRRGGEETVRGLTEEWRAGRNDPSVPFSDVSPMTAFAARLTYRPRERERQEAVCVAADAGDALAVVAWLAGGSADAEDLRRHVDRHAGSGSPSPSRPVVSDDDVLSAVFADEPRRCVLTGAETRSHLIALPFRYATLLSGIRRTRSGVVRFPSTVHALVGAVSHDAWTTRDLHDVAFDAPMERVEAGHYRLTPDVVDAVAGADAEAFALRRLGEM